MSSVVLVPLLLTAHLAPSEAVKSFADYYNNKQNARRGPAADQATSRRQPRSGNPWGEPPRRSTNPFAREFDVDEPRNAASEPRSGNPFDQPRTFELGSGRHRGGRYSRSVSPPSVVTGSSLDVAIDEDRLRREAEAETERYIRVQEQRLEKKVERAVQQQTQYMDEYERQRIQEEEHIVNELGQIQEICQDLKC